MLDALETVVRTDRLGSGGADYLERLVAAVKEHRAGAPFREPTTPTYW